MRRPWTPTYIAPTLPSITEAAAPPSGRLIFLFARQESTEWISAARIPRRRRGQIPEGAAFGVATTYCKGRRLVPCQNAYRCSFHGSASLW